MKSHASRAALRALVLLDLRRGRNRLRRLIHQPLWLLFYAGLAAAVVLMVVKAPAAGAAWGAPAPAGMGLWGGLAAVWILFSLGTRLWGATARSPFTVTAADAVLLFPSPISSRDWVLYQLARSGLQRLAAQLPFLLLWFVLFIQVGVSLDRRGLLAFYLFMLLVGLWGDGLHAITWLALERQPGSRGRRARRRLRSLLTAGALLGLLWLAWPLPAYLAQGSSAAAAFHLLLARAQALAGVPPLSWAAALLEAAVGPGGWSLAAFGGAAGLLGFLWVVAWRLGEGYYEPLVLQGEQDAKLQQAVSSWNVDLQGVALTQLGVVERVGRVQALAIGGAGAWALFWQQANRWLRLELGSWRVGLLALTLLGSLLGLAVRAGAAQSWLWVVPVGFAVFSAPWGYLAEELRRPYIYLIPDPPWKRLLAASLVSAADIVLSYGLMMLVAAAIAAPGVRFFLIGLLALLAASWLAQGALAFSSVAVPTWLGRSARSLIQSLVSLVGLGPGVVTGWLVLAGGGSEAAALVAGSLTTWLVGAALLAVTAALFQHADMAE